MGKCILAGHPPAGGQIGYGTYTGDDASSKFINLGVTPKWVLVVSESGQMVDSYGSGGFNLGGLALQGHPPISDNAPLFKIEGNGFCVYKNSKSYTNQGGRNYYYIYGT